MIHENQLLTGTFDGSPLQCRELAAFYRCLLTDDILPWWLRHAMDRECGGVCSCIRDDGGEPYLPNADTKIWWPHTEALCGALMAYEASRESWCLDWYAKAHSWSFSHFPDPVHGEWTQRLDRRGDRIDKVVALPVKDPFHLPRAIIYAIESLERMG